MGNLIPAGDGGQWTLEACQRFLALVREAMAPAGTAPTKLGGLVAQVLTADRKLRSGELELSVRLIDTCTNDREEGVSLGSRLVREGHAKGNGACQSVETRALQLRRMHHCLRQEQFMLVTALERFRVNEDVLIEQRDIARATMKM